MVNGTLSVIVKFIIWRFYEPLCNFQDWSGFKMADIPFVVCQLELNSVFVNETTGKIITFFLNSASKDLNYYFKFFKGKMVIVHANSRIKGFSCFFFLIK